MRPPSCAARKSPQPRDGSWTLASRRANELYASFVSQVAIAGIASSIPDYPAGVAESMIRNDFAWASENRARILAEWTKRYEGKAAKK